MVQRSLPLRLPRCPPQSLLEERQHRGLQGRSRCPRLRGLPPRSLHPPQPPQPLNLHLPTQVTETGRGEGGAWQGAGRSCPNPLISPASLSDLPGAPLLLAVEDVSDSSVTVSWEPPETLGRLGLQGYVLELRREGGELWAKPCCPQGRWVGGPRPRSWASLEGGRARGSVSPSPTAPPLKAGAYPDDLRGPLVLRVTGMQGQGALGYCLTGNKGSAQSQRTLLRAGGGEHRV